MNIENKVAVVTDSSCSVLPESPLAKENDVSIVPLDIKFYENGNWYSVEDQKLSAAEFYQKMRSSQKLPQTSGGIPGKLYCLYDSLAKENRPIISIHITSRHSSVWESATLGKNLAKENNPHLLLEVIDSKQISLATWFLVEQAAKLAQEGYPLEDIKRQVLETIPKVGIFISLSTFENLVKGGRLTSAAGFISSKLQLRPIVGLAEGEIKKIGLARTDRNAQKELIKRIEDTKNKIIKMAIVHTNFEEGAQLIKQSLSEIFSGNISIHEAGPSLGVHAGEKAIGIAFQTA